jgi:glycosyltransferase involved in cell wall biosynthesis
MQVSVVIPTCDRKTSLLRLLESLNQSHYPIHEVIIVDSGDGELHSSDFVTFNCLSIKYLKSEKSVCIQRNIGIKISTAPFVFICDDDLEVPPDYLTSIFQHFSSHSEAGAVSGLVLQKEGHRWTEQYPVSSSFTLIRTFIFQSSLWGTIAITTNSFFINCIKDYYTKRGNHLSKAGWPVITEFSDPYFRTPIYGLGASVVKREWLINSLYDETLDKHGIGDNYGVAIGFPVEGIHVLKNAFVYHYQEKENRLDPQVLYYRRVLALDYFLQTKKELNHVKRIWFLWSLFGNMISSAFSGRLKMIRVNFKLIARIVLTFNPYVKGKKLGQKIISPEI